MGQLIKAACSLDYNEFLKRLEGAPPVDRAVDSLFNCARETSEQRFCLAILDIHGIELEGRKRLLFPGEGWYPGIAQFEEYLGQVALLNPDELESDEERRFFRRMQMLAYAQCWEYLTFQELLLQLTRICNHEDYDPNLLWENWKKKEQPCPSIYQQIVSKAKRAHLEIAELIEVIYSNQIRNAFAHSQFYFIADQVTFENYNSDDPRNVGSLKLSTWDKLFGLTRDFVIAAFRNRHDADSYLRNKSPFEISLEELGRPFRVRLDERGEWTSA